MLHEKWRDLKRAKEGSPPDQEGFRPSFMLPLLKETIEELRQTHSVDMANPKSFLGMILGKTLQDQPEYKFSIGRDDAGVPLFIAHVIGAQIGQVIRGEGTTRTEAEESAARGAINFLAQEELFPPVRIGAQSCTKFMNEYCQAQMLELSCQQKTSEPPCFTFHVRRAGEVIGEGTGPSKAKAKEIAARAACEYLLERGEGQREDVREGKAYKSLLQEWKAQKKIGDYELVESDDSFSQLSFIFQVKIGEDLTVEGKGPSTEESRENAYRLAFELLLQRQEEALKQQEMLRSAAKRGKTPRIDSPRPPGAARDSSPPSPRPAEGSAPKKASPFSSSRLREAGALSGPLGDAVDKVDTSFQRVREAPKAGSSPALSPKLAVSKRKKQKSPEKKAA